jgi:hypothetical protein
MLDLLIVLSFLLFGAITAFGGMWTFFLVLDLIIPVDSLMSARDYGSTTGKWTGRAVYLRVRPTLISALVVGASALILTFIMPYMIES